MDCKVLEDLKSQDIDLFMVCFILSQDGLDPEQIHFMCQIHDIKNLKYKVFNDVIWLNDIISKYYHRFHEEWTLSKDWL